MAEAVNRQIQKYVKARRNHEDAERETKRLKKIMDAQSAELWDFLESAGLKTASHEVGRFTRTSRVQAAVQDEGLLREYLDDAGLTHAFTKTVLRNRELNALIKESIEEGQEIPGVEPLVIKSITFTQQKRGI